MDYHDLINEPFAISLEELLKLLKDEYNKTRRDAAYCLARDYPRDPRLLEAWIEALDDYDHEVLTQTIAALTEYQDERVIKSLQPLLKNKINFVRREAVEALAKFGEPALDVMFTALDDEDEGVLMVLEETFANHRDLMLEPLLVALEDSNPRKRAGAAYCLCSFDNPKIIEPLIKLFTDRDEFGEARRSASFALNNFKNEQITDVFIKVLKDKTEDSEARAGAAYNLGRLGIKRSTDALLEASKDPSEDLREMAIRYIYRVNLKDTEKVLTEALNDSSQ